MESRKLSRCIALFRVEYLLLAGFEAESELESELIFSARSRIRSRSPLKFVDSAALAEVALKPQAEKG